MPNEIDLPFRPYFEEPMLKDIKILTCRTSPKGRPGDVFRAFGAWFELLAVFRIHLGVIATDCFRQEGCASYQEFIERWKSIHPRTGFDPQQVVWAHLFRKT